jgi:hypothetical protein
MSQQPTSEFLYVHLNTQFYQDFKHCKEMMKDEDRQYLHLVTQYMGNTFFIPFRSEMNHEQGFKFGAGKKGLDFTKSVIIQDVQNYVVSSQKPIPQYQHDLIKINADKIKRDFHRYIDVYRKAVQKNDIRVLKRINSTYSTLQYFHIELGLT